MNEWFYAAGGSRTGPVTLGELQRLAATGAITGRTLVWNPELPEWIPAYRVPDLGLAAEPPPIPDDDRPRRRRRDPDEDDDVSPRRRGRRTGQSTSIPVWLIVMGALCFTGGPVIVVCIAAITALGSSASTTFKGVNTAIKAGPNDFGR